MTQMSTLFPTRTQRHTDTHAHFEAQEGRCRGSKTKARTWICWSSAWVSSLTASCGWYRSCSWLPSSCARPRCAFVPARPPSPEKKGLFYYYKGFAHISDYLYNYVLERNLLFLLPCTMFLPSVWHGWAFPARQSQTDGCPPPTASPQPGQWSPLLPAESPPPAETPEWPSGLQFGPEVQKGRK